MSSSFACAYIDVDDQALYALSDPAYKVLRYLINRADHYGKCSPSIDTIHKAVGKCKDMVQKCLAELVAAGCILYQRRNKFDPESRQKLPNVYRVSPFLYRVRPELQAQAEAEWFEYGGTRLSFPDKYINRNNKTRNKKPEIDTTYLNQQQQEPSENERNQSFSPKQAQADEKEKAKDKAEPDSATHPERETQTKHDSQNSRAATERSEKPAFRSSNTNGINNVHIPLIREPLANLAEERLAHECAEVVPDLAVAFVRGLIHVFGAMHVVGAVNYSNGKARTSPGGYIRSVLVANGVPESYLNEGKLRRYNGEGSGRDYISGPYADFIEH